VAILRDATPAVWPAAAIARRVGAFGIEEVALSGADLPHGMLNAPPGRAVVLPIAQRGQDRPAGFAVAALNNYRPFDTAYRGFVDVLVGQIAAGIANAEAYEAERRRAEALAEIDRTKTAFFSNVSHEFRTPLTLMLGPLEDALSGGGLAPALREQLAVAQRNSLRLLKLVNNLLDFARLEAGRMRAVYEPVDLGALTTDLASNFRSATDRAGLTLHVDCPRTTWPVFVDREMWEKIVLNLLSNAFKFTLQGRIDVTLRERDARVDLVVRDTGIGIAAEELPHVFDRFHRVENAGGRTHEGSGIGLALVHDLVKQHGGSVAVTSEIGHGTTFTVSLPSGSAHLPADRIGASRGGDAATAVAATAYVEEALRWLPESTTQEAAFTPDTEAPPRLNTHGARVLLADDNADMREYVARLLATYWSVEGGRRRRGRARRGAPRTAGPGAHRRDDAPARRLRTAARAARRSRHRVGTDHPAVRARRRGVARRGPRRGRRRLSGEAVLRPRADRPRQHASRADARARRGGAADRGQRAPAAPRHRGGASRHLPVGRGERRQPVGQPPCLRDLRPLAVGGTAHPPGVPRHRSAP
jgi:signal transduction histidine kinase